MPQITLNGKIYWPVRNGAGNIVVLCKRPEGKVWFSAPPSATTRTIAGFHLPAMYSAKPKAK